MKTIHKTQQGFTLVELVIVIVILGILAVVAIPRLSSAITRTGFTAVLENTAGNRVTGTFTWIAQGY